MGVFMERIIADFYLVRAPWGVHGTRNHQF
jgi:hypothetical protein